MKFSIYKLYEPFDLTQYKNTRFMYNPNNREIILGSEYDTVENGSHATLFYSAKQNTNTGYDNYFIKGWIGFGGRKYKNGVIHFAPNIRPEQSEAVMQSIDLVEKLKKHGFTDNTWVRGLVRFDEYKIKDMYEKIQNWQDDVKPYTEQLQDWVNCSFVKDKVYKIAEGVYTSDKLKAQYHNSNLKPYFLLIDSPFYSNGKLTESFENLSKKGFNGIIQGKTFRVFNESEQVKEADAQKDNEVREKVRSIFFSLVKSIKNNPDVGSIVGTENGYGYFINLTQGLKYFYPEYNSKPLYVLIKSADKNYSLYSKKDDYNIIIMNILSDTQIMDMATKQESGKKSVINQFIKKTIVPVLTNEANSFIHEFIHAIDDVRLKNYRGRKESQLNLNNTEYLSDPLEFNAWFQSNIYDFDKDANNEPELKRNWKLFYSYVLDCLPFVKEYNEKYRRKFDVRLWKYWNEFIKDGGKKEVNESLKNEGGFFITNSGRDILNLLQNKPKEYRIVYDANLKLFMICDANEGIHADMLEKAYKNGLYYNMDKFIDSLGSFQNYIETGQDGGWDENDNEINSFLYYMVFDPTGQWEAGDDDYDTVYKLPFGNLFTRKCDLSEIPFYNILPLTEQLNEYDEFDSDDDFWKQDEPEFNDNFWKWFNGSKVVDEDGSPLIVYHGTASKFDVFGDSKFGDYGKGYYFVDSKLKANEYAIRSGGDVIMSAYLSIKNPYIARSSSESQLRSDIGEKFTKSGLPIKKEKITEILSQNGYDGVIIPIGEQPFGFNYYLCFNKNQIKSVDNNGNWSSTSDNVNEVIEEVINDNYLYHGMWKKQFFNCKKEGKLHSHIAYESNGNNTAHRSIKGISMSRNLRVCIKFMENQIKEFQDEWQNVSPLARMHVSFGDNEDENYVDASSDLSYVVLVFDRNKLKQNHKIIPHSYLGGRMRDSFGDEQEELVVGDIPNFMNYVVDVIEFNNNINSKTLKSKKNVVESSEPKLNDNFWKWFRGSKIINKDGTPHLCYHYSPNKFNTFDINRKIDNGYFGNGIYFTGMTGWGYSFGRNKYECYIRITNPLNFELFEESNYDAESLLEYLKQYEDESYPIILQKDYDDYNEYSKAEGIKSYDLTFSKIHHGLLEPYGEYITQYAKDMGYDGIISDSGYTEIVVFEPNQIKSVDNNGDWSFTSDNINESFAPKLNDNFWKWFGDSKCVDEKGHPQLCVHYTNADFDTFDINKSQSTNLMGNGFYFSTIDNKQLKQNFGKNVKKCYLSIKNPFFAFNRIYNRNQFEPYINKKYLDIIFADNSKIIGMTLFYNLKAQRIEQSELDITEVLKKMGYDGICLKENNIWVAFYPNQIKSVNNNGNWSFTSDNINEANESAEPNLNQNFWSWFGDSVCVDDTGAPLVLYHGTSSEFNKFKKGFIFTTDNQQVADGYGYYGAMPVFVRIRKPFIVDAFNQDWQEIYNAEGFKKKYKDLTDEDIEKLYKAYEYFESLEDAKQYYEESKKYNPDDYINLARAYGQKPHSTNEWAQYAKNKGYDGCIIKNVVDGFGLSDCINPINEYIVWNPEQVKSVNNNGEWSESDKLMESFDTRKIIVYHGSSDKNLKIKDNSTIFFTNDKEDAKRWAKRQILGGKKNKENYIYKAEITVNNPYIIGDSMANPEYAQYKDITNEIEKKDIYTEIFFDDITNNCQKLVSKGYDCFLDNMIGNNITYYVIPSEFKNNIKWLKVEKI